MSPFSDDAFASLEPSDLQGRAVLVAAVGNTRTQLGLVLSGELHDVKAFVNTDLEPLAAHARTLTEGHAGTLSLLASVNDTVAKRVRVILEDAAGEVYVVGKDVDIPMALALDDVRTVGHDRLLASLAAYRLLKQAVVVVDAGTAITVNFVDGAGTFQGGVIAPGLSAMLRAMRASTAQLPAMAGDVFVVPDASRGAFGKDTQHAMSLGVVHAARGLVRSAVEAFAEAYEAYPAVVATGGDCEMLFKDDGLIERIVPDLVLLGMAELCKPAAEGEESDEEEA
jgi:type III pantothenate kinase